MLSDGSPSPWFVGDYVARASFGVALRPLCGRGVPMILAVMMLWFICLVKVPTSTHTMHPSASELPLTARCGRGVLSLVVVTTFGLLGQKAIHTTTMQTTSAELPYCLYPWSRSAINVTSFEATNSPASGNQLWMAVPNFNGVACMIFIKVEEYMVF